MDKELLIKLQKDKSHKMLADADEMVIQKRWDIAANRYYYACYHMLQALFISRGVSAKSHDGSLTHLGQDFILSGEVTEDEVLEMQPLSREFVEQVEAIILVIPN